MSTWWVRPTVSFVSATKSLKGNMQVHKQNMSAMTLNPSGFFQEESAIDFGFISFEVNEL